MFLLKINFCTCLEESGVKVIFSLVWLLIYFLQLLFSFLAVASGFVRTQKEHRSFISKQFWITPLNTFYNHFHNILRLFDVLPTFLSTTSETMRDYYLKTCYTRIVLRVAEQLKMARVVNIKLLFYELILLWFDNTNQAIQNPIQQSRQSPTAPKKPGSQPQKQKTLTSSNHHRAQYPPPKPLTQGRPGHPPPHLDLELRPCLDLGSKHSVFAFLLITQDQNKIKKIANTLS